MADPINAVCKKTYHAVHSSGQRDTSVIKWIVMHDEESNTAEAAARWFANPNSGGSAHLCVDDKECFRTLENDEIPWGAPGANTEGFHIEQAGYARWSAVVWKSHLNTLKRAAYKAALHCKAFDIPPVFVDSVGLKAGHKGITTHAECTKAFGGNHTDPGLFWPRSLFMFYVNNYYKQMK